MLRQKLLGKENLTLAKVQEVAWIEECEKAVVRSKSKLVADKVLVPYDEKRKMILACDATLYGVPMVWAP